jgi:hypothetical protein
VRGIEEEGGIEERGIEEGIKRERILQGIGLKGSIGRGGRHHLRKRAEYTLKGERERERENKNRGR